jgi:hypothetical protein
MIFRLMTRTLSAAAIACLAFAANAQAQQEPSAAAVALAAQIIELKGGTTAFDPAIDGVFAHHKGIFLQMNPSVSKAMDEIERSMSSERAARLQELHNEMARGYAAKFTEQDLKDLVAFYKSPLGKKIIELEPQAGEEVAKRVQLWIDKYADNVSTKIRAELKKKGFTEF